jgi:cytochrome P450
MELQSRSILDDLLSPEAITDPHAYFGQLRQDDPVHWNASLRAWVLTSYEDVVSVCRRPGQFSSDKLGFNVSQLPEGDREEYRGRYPAIFAAYPHVLSAVDNPVHEQFRSIVNQVWTPLLIEKRRSRIRSFVHELLDRWQDKDEIDFIRDFSLELPLKVILDFLGLPDDDWREVKACSDQWRTFHFGSGADPARWRSGVEGITGLIGFVSPRIRELKAKPADDYISSLLQAEWKGHRLSDDQVSVHCATMIFAGHETTTNLLANGLHLLLSHRDQWDRIHEDPALLRSAVEEVIRLEGSIKCMVRYALEDAQIRDKKIRKGDLVLLVNTAANSDPAKFTDPGSVDVSRRPNAHLGFGHGIHICLGAPLARIEAHETYLALNQRFPSMRIATESVDYHPILRARALKALPIVLR